MCIASLGDELVMSDWIEGWHRQTILNRFDRLLKPVWIDETTPVISEAIKELQQYFNRERTDFDLPVRLIGTPFQIKIWLALQKIPYGEIKTYGDIAQAIGQPKANRAVGGAVGQNPLSIVVPCHRVLGNRNALTGYGGGMLAKEKLLEIEGIFPNIL